MSLCRLRDVPSRRRDDDTAFPPMCVMMTSRMRCPVAARRGVMISNIDASKASLNVLKKLVSEAGGSVELTKLRLNPLNSISICGFGRVGEMEGKEDGAMEGELDGLSEGSSEGDVEGLRDGSDEGLSEGRSDGDCEGFSEGLSDGVVEG